MKTFCNPIDINYRFDNNRWRQAADPVVTFFEGNYYLFASKCGGYYVSPDMKDWQLIEPKGMPELAIEEYAPASMVYNGELYYMVCREENLYRAKDAKAGIWERVGPMRKVVDPAFLVDDDNRVYMYWGCWKIWGVELDPNNNFAEIGEPKFLFTHDVANRGWEGSGDDHTLGRSDDSPGKTPWTEGVWMTKHNDKYYMQVSAPGTGWVSYADGGAVSDSPLGNFQHLDYNPISMKATGHAPGAGHGAEFIYKDGMQWRVDTTVISNLALFERRINMFRAGFDKDDVMFTDTYLSCLPQYLPGEDNGDASTNNLKGWMLLSYGKPATASSSHPNTPLELAFDEDMKTIWSTADSANQAGTIITGKDLVEGSWKGEYFTNMKLEGKPALQRQDAEINFHWDASPAPELPADGFSCRWTGTYTATCDGSHDFLLTGDDGIRLFVDDKLVANDWSNHGPRLTVESIDLIAGQQYKLRLEHYEHVGGATAKLAIQLPASANQNSFTGNWLQVDLEAPAEVHAIQVNHGEYKADSVKHDRSGNFRYTIEHSNDGKTWHTTVDRSAGIGDHPHDYMELSKPVTARYFKIREIETPYRANFSIRDFRIFGFGPGEAPALPANIKAIRDVNDARNVTITWDSTAENAEGYVVRYGIAPDKLYNSYIIRGEQKCQINALTVGVDYFFAVDAFNSAGINQAKTTTPITNPAE